MEISVYRYNPDTDNAPYMQDFDLDIPGGRDLMVLDVLELLKEKDPLLPTDGPVERECVARTEST